MRQWWPEQAEYCGARRPDRLLAEYDRLISAKTFVFHESVERPGELVHKM